MLSAHYWDGTTGCITGRADKEPDCEPALIALGRAEFWMLFPLCNLYLHYNCVKSSTLIINTCLFLLYFIFVDLGVPVFLLLAMSIPIFLFNRGPTSCLGEWKKSQREWEMEKWRKREAGEITSSSTMTALKGQVSVLSLIQPLPINCPFKNVLQSFRTVKWEIWK